MNEKIKIKIYRNNDNFQLSTHEILNLYDFFQKSKNTFIIKLNIR